MKDEVEITGKEMSSEDWDNFDREQDESLAYTLRIIDDADYDKVKRFSDNFAFKLLCSFLLGTICYLFCNAIVAVTM